MSLRIPLLSTLLSTMLSTLLLSACGGGGGSNNSTAPVDNNDPPPAADTFQVSSVTPANESILAQFPQDIAVVFNRDLSTDSATENSVTVTASGGDDNFNSGNETVLTANTIDISGENLTLDFTGTNLSDELFQLTLVGDGDNSLTDSEGEALDGDEDDAAGGNFTTTFRVDTALPDQVSFSSIQDIFSNNCTFSGCHSGVSPAEGMNLSSGQAYTNIVGVSSSEMPSLQRIEPGNPDDSYLVRKIEGTASVGERMPLSRNPLSTADIQQIRDWVSEGAMDN